MPYFELEKDYWGKVCAPYFQLEKNNWEGVPLIGLITNSSDTVRIPFLAQPFTVHYDNRYYRLYRYTSYLYLGHFVQFQVRTCSGNKDTFQVMVISCCYSYEV